MFNLVSENAVTNGYHSLDITGDEEMCAWDGRWSQYYQYYRQHPESEIVMAVSVLLCMLMRHAS